MRGPHHRPAGRPLCVNLPCWGTKHSLACRAVAIDASQSLGEAVRPDFPILDQKVNGRRLVYLDSAATSQKPQEVIDKLVGYYQGYNANVHRGVHHLSARATTEYEAAREKIAKFINAASDREIVFTRNASEAINLVANTWGLANLMEGDEIVTTVMEHHSNIVPWQLLAEKTGAVLKFCELNESQELDMKMMEELITPRTKLVSVVHISNMLGCVNPVEDIAALARKVGAKVLLDACQSVPHMPVDVQVTPPSACPPHSLLALSPVASPFPWQPCSEVLCRAVTWGRLDCGIWAQNVCTDRDWLPVGQVGGACKHASMDGRRRDDCRRVS